MRYETLVNTKARYGAIAQFFHWTTALLVLVLLVLGVVMSRIPASSSEQIADKVWLYSLHKTLGMTVLSLAVLRIVWALVSTKPAPVHPERKMETLAAETVHWLLYGCIILVPLSGYVHHLASVGFAPVWGPFPINLAVVPKSLELSKQVGFFHFLLAILMAGSIGLHIAGALKHVVIDKDNTVQRMVPYGANTSGSPAKASVTSENHSVAVAITIAVFAATFGFGFLISEQNEDNLAKTQNQTASEELRDKDTKFAAHQWTVDHAVSELQIAIKQMGDDVEGVFSTWDADIVFNVDDLKASKILVRVDTGSLSLGAVTDQAKSADFLNVEKFPDAVFSSTDIVRSGDKYLANGTLSLHGVTVPVNLLFSLDIVDETATVKGNTTLNRMNFDVGADGFADEGSVAFDVQVNVDLTATRKK